MANIKKKKRKAEGVQGGRGKQEELWPRRWVESGEASATFEGMVTTNGALLLLPELWKIVKSFFMASKEQILAYKRACVNRLHCIWSLYTGEHHDTSRLAVLHDGKIVTISDFTNKARVWTQDGGEYAAWTGGDFADVIVSDESIVTAGWDKDIKVWTQEGEWLQTIQTDHTGWISAVTVMPDGKIVTGSFDKTAKVWTPEGECLHTLSGHSYTICAVTVTPDGLIVTGSGDGTAKVWAPEGECLYTLTGGRRGGPVRAVAALPDGKIVTSSHSVARIWTREGQCMHTLIGHTSFIVAVAVLPKGLVVTASNDSTVRIWDTTSGQCLAVLKDSDGAKLTAMTTTTTGSIVTASDKKVKIYGV